MGVKGRFLQFHCCFLPNRINGKNGEDLGKKNRVDIVYTILRICNFIDSDLVCYSVVVHLAAVQSGLADTYSAVADH